MRTRNKMASRVALRHMKKEGFLGDLLDLILEPKNQNPAKPKHQEFKVWLKSNPVSGYMPHWLKQRLKMGDKNIAIIRYRNTKIEISVRTVSIMQGESPNAMTDNHIVVSATGVDADVNKKLLQEVLFNALREARVRTSDIIQKEPTSKKH
jgi:hypothetical protein